MTNETKQDVLYTIFNNLLEITDGLFRNQIKEAGEVHYLVNQVEGLNETQKKQIMEDLDTLQYKFQVFREYVNSANKCLNLLGLPELKVNWVVVLDENDKTVDKN